MRYSPASELSGYSSSRGYFGQSGFLPHLGSGRNSSHHRQAQPIGHLAGHWRRHCRHRANTHHTDLLPGQAQALQVSDQGLGNTNGRRLRRQAEQDSIHQSQRREHDAGNPAAIVEDRHVSCPGQQTQDALEMVGRQGHARLSRVIGGQKQAKVRPVFCQVFQQALGVQFRQRRP